MTNSPRATTLRVDVSLGFWAGEGLQPSLDRGAGFFGCYSNDNHRGVVVSGTDAADISRKTFTLMLTFDGSQRDSYWFPNAGFSETA
jgi:hypothetical protein